MSQEESFFTPIDLPDQAVEDVTADPSVPNWPSPKLFGPILDKISIEVDRITNGTSEFTPHGIQLDRDATFTTVWGRFKENPTQANMNAFLDLTENCVNLRARREFQKWIDLALKGKK
jgi:hypothetical protein